VNTNNWRRSQNYSSSFAAALPNAHNLAALAPEYLKPSALVIFDGRCRRNAAINTGLGLVSDDFRTVKGKTLITYTYSRFKCGLNDSALRHPLDTTNESLTSLHHRIC
tara:strand:- start:113 stop:436 length:324 start_codon:yes stop_codon:yes gene_type:complete